jgi:hypothetical protein
MFLICFTSYCNINIHHIHICSNCFYFNMLNFYYVTSFPWNILCISTNFGECHFVSIQTTNVAGRSEI